MDRYRLRLSPLASHVRSPVTHEPAPALEQVRTPIGCLDSVLDDVLRCPQLRYHFLC